MFLSVIRGDAMKAFLGEIFDPIIEFYQMRIKSEIFVTIFIPLLIGGISYFVGFLIHPKYEFSLIDFCVGILDQLLTILTLFISFSMAYLSILITSSSKNVDGLKDTPSKKYFLKGKPCSLYQVLSSEITYTLVFEIFFMVIVLMQRFLIYMCSSEVLQILLAVNIALFIHVLLMMLIIIKNIYFSFWKSH